MDDVEEGLDAADVGDGGLGGVGNRRGDTPGRWLQEARREIEFRVSQTGSAWNIPFLNLFQRDLCVLLFASDERSRFGLLLQVRGRHHGVGKGRSQFNLMEFPI